LLLLALWALSVSSQQGSRLLLVVACMSLGLSLLSHEAGFPLALLGFALIGFQRRSLREGVVWMCAWLMTLVVFAARVMESFWTGIGAHYQLGYMENAPTSLKRIASRLVTLLAPALRYFHPTQGLFHYLVVALLAFALTGLTLWWVSRGSHRWPSVRVCLTGLGLATAGVLLALLPFFPLPGTGRTQFYAAPAEAVLLALGLALVLRPLSGQARGVLAAAAVAVLAARATIDSYYIQDNTSRYVCYEKTVYMLQQLHAVSPTYAPQTMIVFDVEDGLSAPLGFNYAARFICLLMLGTPSVQANVKDPLENAAFSAKGVTLIATKGRKTRTLDEWSTPWERIIMFRVGPDGTLFLLPELPADGPWPREAAAKYAPLALLRPGPIAPLKMQYPFWFAPPSDVVDQRAGILLGRGWSDLDRDGDSFSRQADADAEIVVNSLGQSSRDCSLDVEPAFVGIPYRLVARDDRGHEAAAYLTGRQRITLTLPCDPDRVGLYRLRLERVDGLPGTASFRAFCLPGGPPMLLHAPPPPDITLDGFRIGSGWYSLEHFGGDTFRWVDSDAVIRIGRTTPGRSRQLRLTVEPGPGMGGRPCHLHLVDSGGRTVGAVTVARREDVSIPVPADLPFGTPLKLCVDGGGDPTPGDPRLLNIRVFRCGWAP
jgi:hypothetical protein